MTYREMAYKSCKFHLKNSHFYALAVCAYCKIW